MDVEGVSQSIWLVGDLDDPWVERLRAAIAPLAPILGVQAGEGVPARPFDPEHPPEIVILHRSRLGQADVSRLDGWRVESRRDGMPRIILCYSPYVRHAELEMAMAKVDLALPEALAVETLPRHVRRLVDLATVDDRAVPEQGFRVDVISSDHELRDVLAEACMLAGFQPRLAPAFEEPAMRDAAPTGVDVTLWDVPVLEPDWPDRLERLSRVGPVVTLLGFPDRTAVNLARARGASACLEMPFDLDDLVDILGRVARSAANATSPGGSTRSEPAHSLPPAPLGPAVPLGRAAIRRRPAMRPPWSDEGAGPRMMPAPID